MVIATGQHGLVSTGLHLRLLLPGPWLDGFIWCSCGRCQVLSNFEELECVRYREIDHVVTAQLKGCITEHLEFSLLCLNIAALQVAYFKLRAQQETMSHYIHNGGRVVEHPPRMREVRGSIPSTAGYPPVIQWVQAFPWSGARLLRAEMLGKRSLTPP
ncbi:uncharacterized protein LOC144094337 [Amblyomma americanum]